MPKRTTLGDIQPPSRDEKKPITKFEGTKAGDTEPISNRINASHMRYLRMLSASTGKSQKILLEDAIDLLREKEGEI